jgi:ankyrin repeat protein
MLRKTVVGSLSMGLFGVLCASVLLLAAAQVEAPVADAAMAGDIDTVRLLLSQGVDVNAIQGDGMTALHWAASNGDLEMAGILLAAGADVAAVSRVGNYTPLLLASRSGSAPMIDSLLVAGAETNSATTTTEMTPLMMAAASGSADAVRLLLDNGADVNAQESSHGQTALMLAAAVNRVDVVAVLMDRGADSGIATKIRMAPVRTRPSPQTGQQPGARGRGGNPPPLAASGRGRGAGAGRGQAGQTVAAAQANFFDREQDPTIPLGGLTALHYVARQGHIASARSLLDAGADVNLVSPGGDKTSPLLMAAINGRFDLAMAMLDSGADPNLSNAWGMTPLYAVVNVQWAPHAFYPTPSADQERTTHMELIKKLLDHGADPDSRMTARRLWYNVYASGGVGNLNESGATAFWRAAQSSDIDALRLLAAGGADPNIPTEEGTTALNVAAGAGWRGNLNVNAPAGWMPAVRYLVEGLGADVALGNEHGYTPLHAAAERGDNEMILYLVEKGGDVTAVTTRGETVADMANGPRQRIRPFLETIALLMKLGSGFNDNCISC